MADPQGFLKYRQRKLPVRRSAALRVLDWHEVYEPFAEGDLRDQAARCMNCGIPFCNHGCEYMTGGRVVVLGRTGRNFGAGMSGGVAYVHDPDGTFPALVNPEMVDLDPLTDEDRAFLADRVKRHQEETDSTVAGRLLADWASECERFVKVMPRDYKAVLEATRRAEAEGVDPLEAVMAAAHG